MSNRRLRKLPSQRPHRTLDVEAMSPQDRLKMRGELMITKTPANAVIYLHALIQRVVFPDCVCQTGALIYALRSECRSIPADGIPVPDGFRLPNGPNGDVFIVPRPREVPYARELDMLVSDAVYRDTLGFNTLPVRDPGGSVDVSVFALVDRRVVGYATATITGGFLLFAAMVGGRVSPAKSVFIPPVKGIEFHEVNIIWTADSFRRQGVCRRLLGCLSQYLGVAQN